MISQMRAARSTASTSRQPVRITSTTTTIHLSPFISTSINPADPLSLISAIHDRKMKAGVAISPDTPSTAITDEVAEAADMLLVMTVYPGTIATFAK